MGVAPSILSALILLVGFGWILETNPFRLMITFLNGFPRMSQKSWPPGRIAVKIQIGC